MNLFSGACALVTNLILMCRICVEEEVWSALDMILVFYSSNFSSRECLSGIV